MCSVDGVDELVCGPILLWGHPRPLPVTGEETSTIPNIRSIVKSLVEPTPRFASPLTSRRPPVGRQVQLWFREVGLDGARAARDRYEDAGADTLLFVLDDERDPDTIARLADVDRRAEVLSGRPIHSATMKARVS